MFTDHELKLGTLLIPQTKPDCFSLPYRFLGEREATLLVSAMEQNLTGLRFKHTPRNEHISCINNRILGNILRTNGLFRIHLGIWHWSKNVKKKKNHSTGVSGRLGFQSRLHQLCDLGHAVYLL